ncbi:MULTISPECIES: hypothetical protein [Protofrankia]|uniref:Uncharacterized protein n=1 Tax=Protofrankia coriariae TaxID=1562887 RepID=A0ABR5F4G0_9ACTN|nr:MULTISPECIES: hypothetical protein [Protofrankia]KLL11555.1 hypothetical protein FrCorBMG51_10975 [Protofrankia coriariae]ONH35688.1 hypothetical protein BL254_10370 [Protofrankia sp. BMG5.30]
MCDPLPLPGLEQMDADARRARRRRREEEWRQRASAHPRTCTSCRAPIRWALTQADPPRWMPLADTPDPAGPVVVIRDGAVPVAYINPPSRQATGRLRWRPHWQDCPSAEQHRRR